MDLIASGQMKIWILAFAALTLRVSAEAYEFSLNGKNLSPTVSRVFSAPGAPPLEGDVVWIADFPVVLAGPGTYDFKTDASRNNVLVGKFPGETTEHAISVKVEEHWDDKKTQLEDPLATMSAEAKAGLHGVVLEARPKDVAKSFESINWSKTFLAVDQSFCEKDKITLSPLPDGLRYFSLELSVTPSLSEFGALEKATNLVWLGLDSGVKLNARLLTGMTELRRADLSFAEVIDTPKLAALSKLRILNLHSMAELQSLDFIASLKGLWELDISGTAVTDLSPLNGLKELVEINANRSQIGEFPNSPDLPALKRLKLLSTPASAAKVEAFRKDLPGCRIDSSWLDSLQEELRDVDRFRVRTGGTCHHDSSTEKTLFEITDKAEIKRIVNSWTINDRDSGFHCMCCGEPSFEFYHGNQLVATLGFHHGRSLRWPGGWPGDALLTEVASDEICEMLAKHGLTGPKTEHEKEKKQIAAQKQLWSACLKIVPEAVMDDWEKASEKDEDMYAVAVKAWPDATDRAGRLFSLYGVMPGRSWRASAGLDDLLSEKLLPKVPVKEAMALLERKDLPDELMNGLARWALFGNDGKSFRQALQGEMLKRVGTWALIQPNADNRIEALYGLAALPKQGGKVLMLDFLAKKFEPRAATEEIPEAGDSIVYLPHADAPDEGAGDLATCAWLLSGTKTKEAKPLIQERIKEASAPDKKLLEKSLKRLDSKK